MIDDAEELFEQRVGETLMTMVRIKSIMLRENLSEYQTECPRCGEILRAALAGHKRHIRMACDGRCGMELLE